MIVDLMRNDLARISVAGSVEVPELFAVETYPTVHQMVSRITSRLRVECDAIDVLRTIFPCGSVTGAPKIAAIEALSRLEPEPRGAYTGSMGWIEPHAMAMPATRRSTSSSGRSNGTAASTNARLGLGSGLVVDSEPSNEWAECLLKGDFVRRESPGFRSDRDDGLRSQSEGIIELERHLDRMKNSADDLGFPVRSPCRPQRTAGSDVRQQAAGNGPAVAVSLRGDGDPGQTL